MNIRKQRVSPLQLHVRKICEDIAIAIIDDNFGNLNKDKIKRIMQFLDMVWVEKPVSGRFGQLLRGALRERILSNPLESLNELFIEIYWKENLDTADRFSELEGVGDGFISCLLYLKNRDKYNIFLPETKSGLEIAFETRIEGDTFRERYEQFNQLANKLRSLCKLKPQEVDLILWALVQTS